MAKKRRLITRRRLKWAGTMLVALIIVVFIVSGKYWCSVRWYAANTQEVRKSIFLGNGHLSLSDVVKLQETDTGRSARWESGDIGGYRINWRLRWQTQLAGGYRVRELTVPLWLPLLLIAAPTAWLWYIDRRAKPWQCAKCRYDLRGLASEGNEKWGGACPECGTPRGGACPECGTPKKL